MLHNTSIRHTFRCTENSFPRALSTSVACQERSSELFQSREEYTGRARTTSSHGNTHSTSASVELLWNLTDASDAQYTAAQLINYNKYEEKCTTIVCSPCKVGQLLLCFTFHWLRHVSHIRACPAASAPSNVYQWNIAELQIVQYW